MRFQHEPRYTCLSISISRRSRCVKLSETKLETEANEARLLQFPLAGERIRFFGYFSLKQPACKIDAVARTGVALSALIACAARRKSLNGSVHQAYSSLSMHSTRNSVPSRGHPMPRSVLLPFCTLHVLDPAPRVAFHVRARQRDAPKQTETLLSRLYVVCRSK